MKFAACNCKLSSRSATPLPKERKKEKVRAVFVACVSCTKGKWEKMASRPRPDVVVGWYRHGRPRRHRKSEMHGPSPVTAAWWLRNPGRRTAMSGRIAHFVCMCRDKGQKRTCQIWMPRFRQVASSFFSHTRES